MKLETIKKDKKKKIIIGSMIVLSVVGCFTLTTTRAKYKNIQNIKLANGTIDYKAPDLKLAIKVSEDGTTYKNSSTIPEGNYTLNEEKSKCRIPTSTLVGEEAPVAEGVSIEYTNGKINVLGVTKKDTRCYVYFDKFQSQTVSSILAEIKSRTDGSYKGNTTPTFTSIATGTETEINNGIYETDDPMYGENAKTYYWRGAATTNHVIFADMCWRIVRINGDESIRLIYNGESNENICSGNGANIASVVMGTINENYYATSTGAYNNASYVGWTYTLNNQWPNENVLDSNAKHQTEKWYKTNILDKGFDAKVSTGKFCNDRNVGTAPSNWNGYVTTWNTTNEKFVYAFLTRLYVNYNPTLICSDARDIYNLKVGALSADEAMFAGSSYGNNTSFYLYTGQSYWTMSPSHWGDNAAGIFRVNENGGISFTDLNWTGGALRPVINLKPDVTFNLGSDGTENNPYIVQ